MEPSLKVGGSTEIITTEQNGSNGNLANIIINHQVNVVDNISTTSSNTTTTTTQSYLTNNTITNSGTNIPCVALEPFPHAPGRFLIHEAVYNNDMNTLIEILGEVDNSTTESQQSAALSPQTAVDLNDKENEDRDDDEDDDDSPLEAGKLSVNDRDSLGRTPLMYANKLETLRFLLAKSARVNLRDQERQTAMHRAAFNGLTEILSVLLDCGAHIKRDSNGCTPLHLACSIGSISCASTMIEKGPRRVKAEARDKKGKTALHYAVESSSPDDISVHIVSALVSGGSMLDSKDREKKSPLHIAAILGKIKCIVMLVEKGANVEIADYLGATPLHYAVTNQSCHKAVKLMVNRGAKVNAIDNTGQTPIFYASRSGHPKNVKALLRSGAQASVKDYQNKTPLHFSLDIANPTISSMLVSGGADAYSIYDQEVGYCQGMSGIASILLMYMTEEEAFWSLVSLMENEKYELRGLFLPSFPLLYRHYAIHESLLHDELPRIQSHFGIEGVTTSMYATKWFLTVFSGNVPFPLLIRFWDLVLIHGYYVIHTLVIHILRINQDTLIKEGFEKILSIFSSLDSNGIDTYSFCKGARKHKISEKKVAKLLKKHDLQQTQLHIHPGGVPINS
ncbi:ankyrin repeat-containing protein [Heterostelium album PN500]|uniref:Ankyrin repeat-containing protein n=1 Tax=Heterostelium pallidum (strain ATCC 26659 / Pp 5 / PN500) TaxID=670386 RepID=D3AZ00_HETP5|nr:ankyrin repeat-containing protein [Heterostelium album PN500]EFA85690.1 ankyrin repeat-containing protein [Heterostelium album PN500]|eukprot:XP_020437797.1 ankyrin repeat-containing protein [Heterostelium album PN500]